MLCADSLTKLSKETIDLDSYRHAVGNILAGKTNMCLSYEFHLSVLGIYLSMNRGNMWLHTLPPAIRSYGDNNVTT